MKAKAKRYLKGPLVRTCNYHAVHYVAGAASIVTGELGLVVKDLNYIQEWVVMEC